MMGYIQPMETLMITRLFTLSIIAALFSIPALAQTTLTDAEIETLTRIDTALQNTIASDSYTSTGTMTVNQTITSDEDGFPITVDQQIVQTMRGSIQRIDEATIAADMRVEQVIASVFAGTTTEIEQTLEFVVLPDDAYVRVSDVVPSEIAALYPEGWIVLNELATTNPVFAVLNPDQFVSTVTNPIPVSLDATVVTGLTTLDNETVDGVVFERYSLTIDPEALFNEEATATMLGAFDFSQLGVDMDSFLEAFAAGSEIEYELWLNTETMLVTRNINQITTTADVEFTLEGQAIALTITQNAVADVDFGDFDVPVEITAPIE